MPPAATTAAGATSAMSEVADPVRIRISSASASATSAAASAAVSCATWRSSSIASPKARQRSVTAADLPGLAPPTTVWISRADPNATSRSRSAPWPAASASATAASGTP